MPAVPIPRPRLRRARAAVLACVLGAALLPALAQKRVAACDLLDEKGASALLRAPIAEHTPNRDFEEAGKTVSSWCYFAASHSNVRVQLFQYPDGVAATAAVRQVTSRKGEAAYTEEKGLGDQGWWWAMPDDRARGFIVRKGANIVVLDVRSEARVAPQEAKRMLRPRMPALLKRL